MFGFGGSPFVAADCREPRATALLRLYTFHEFPTGFFIADSLAEVISDLWDLFEGGHM